MTAAQMFARLSGLGYVPELRNLNTALCFVIHDVGEWTVKVQNGNVSVTPGRSQSECVEATCSEQDFRELLLNGRRVSVLVMQGRVQVTGTFERLLQAKPLFRVLRDELKKSAGAGEEAHP